MNDESAQAALPTDDAIVDYVREHDHVSFPELMNRFALPRGDVALNWVFRDRGDVVLWAGMSEATAALIDRLVFVEKRLGPVPCSWWIYAADGGLLRLPIVKRRPPIGGFKTPHWLPVTLRPAERMPQPSRRRTR